MTPILYTVHQGQICSINYNGEADRRLTVDEARAGQQRYEDRAAFCRRKRDINGAFIAKVIADELREAIEAVGAISVA